jgi:endonuclease-3
MTSTVAERPARAAKRPLDIDAVFHKLRKAVAGLPKAAMFELRDRGHGTPFEQLAGSLISARTRDETTVAVCERLFKVARTPQQFVKLDEKRLAQLLHGASFPEPKARDLKAIARRLVEKFDGEVPGDAQLLMEFRGVGPKIAALTLAVGFGKPAIAVDIHVHRVTNRWGYVRTAAPEQTMAALLEKLPKRYWIEINERLVPFGKAICVAVRPLCSTCPLLSMCRQVGVSNPR